MTSDVSRRTVLAALAAAGVGAVTGIWRAAGPSGAAPTDGPGALPTLPPLLGTPAPTPTPSPSSCSTVVVAVGDIVKNIPSANRTARVAKSQDPAMVLLLGDLQYRYGTKAEWANGYAKTEWADLKDISKPCPGGHEYLTEGAAGYFGFFDGIEPYYAFDVDCGWRGYSLNSEIPLAPQVKWLRKDLAAHPDVPVIAYWHRPRFSSGSEHGSAPSMQPLWAALKGRQGIVLGGHDHHYERFAPRDGLRQFVVGTGSDILYAIGRPVRGSERRIMASGVLRLTLRADGYDWSFRNTDDRALDKGTQALAALASR
jgi:hypothetical protein